MFFAISFNKIENVTIFLPIGQKSSWKPALFVEAGFYTTEIGCIDVAATYMQQIMQKFHLNRVFFPHTYTQTHGLQCKTHITKTHELIAKEEEEEEDDMLRV